MAMQKFEVDYHSSHSVGWGFIIEAESYEHALHRYFEELKGYDYFPRYAQVDLAGNVTFRGKIIGDIHVVAR